MRPDVEGKMLSDRGLSHGFRIRDSGDDARKRDTKHITDMVNIRNSCHGNGKWERVVGRGSKGNGGRG